MLPLESLLGSLLLEPAGDGRFTAPNADAGHGVVFGGQLLAQSIVAAVEADGGDKRVKTIHTVFARGASHEHPVEIHVDPMSTGRTFASSTVTITQGDTLCARSLVLLSADEPDFVHHADPAPDRSPPDGSPEQPGHFEAFETVIADDIDINDPALVGPPDLDVWVRVPGAPDGPTIHAGLLAFISDGYLIATAMRPHPGVGQSQAHVTVATSVVSHTLTFHEPFTIDDWLLLVHHSDHAGGGRSHGRARVFTPDGRLVATYVQDALLRG